MNRNPGSKTGGSDPEPVTESELLRLLHGELDDDWAQRLRRLLETDSELRAAYGRLERSWQGLELPEAEPAPPGFATRVTVVAFGSEQGSEQAIVPAWFRDTLLGRAAAVAALSGGILLGIFLAYPQQSSAEYADVLSDEPSMAESYWDLLDDPDQTLWDEVGE